jgi:hypothetical protein
MRTSRSGGFSRVRVGLMVRKKFEFKGFIDGVIGLVVTGSMVSEIRARLEVVIRDKAWRAFKG